MPLTLTQYALAGGFAGICISFVEGPIDLFKSQMQVCMLHYLCPGPLLTNIRCNMVPAKNTLGLLIALAKLSGSIQILYDMERSEIDGRSRLSFLSWS